ncbi:MAG TPA: GNAT family N-acetyltransferase [Pseudoneobacillus sp.]|nr:GNAT family N-acetyltransferase [Pseudoneobacillus sp.]
MNLLNSFTPQLVQFNELDIPGLIDLSASVGWDYDKYEIQTVLSSGKIFGHKNKNGEVISSAAIIEYDKNLASIGMVIVNDSYRGLGLGKLATQKCLDSISNQTIAMLIATEAGKPMYEKMGFRTTDSIHKYICESYIPNNSSINHSFNIEPFSDKDFSEILKLDHGAFGVQREHFLVNRIAQAKEALILKDVDSKIIAYGLSINGPVQLVLGPIVAPNPQLAMLLVGQLTKNHHGPFRIDVPSGNEDFMRNLESVGFKKASNPPVMIKNGEQLPPRDQTLFAIAAQIFG